MLGITNESATLNSTANCSVTRGNRMLEARSLTRWSDVSSEVIYGQLPERRRAWQDSISRGLVFCIGERVEVILAVIEVESLQQRVLYPIDAPFVEPDKIDAVPVVLPPQRLQGAVPKSGQQSVRNAFGGFAVRLVREEETRQRVGNGERLVIRQI